jgi:hypothetical protein
MTYVILLFFAIFAGIMSGVFGTGGAFFSIPFLSHIVGFDQKIAQGTVMVMVIFNLLANAIKSEYTIEKDIFYKILAGGIIGSVIGIFIQGETSSESLKEYYSVFLIFIALLLLVSRVSTFDGLKNKIFYFFISFFGGISISIFSIGGALIAVPLIMLMYKEDQLFAQKIGAIVAIPSSIIGFYYFFSHDYIDWNAAIILTVFSAFMVKYGIRIARLVGKKYHFYVYSLAILLVGVVSLLTDV